MAEYKYRALGWKDDDIASLNVVDGTAADNQVELQITKQGAGGTIDGPAIIGKDGITIDKAADSEKIEISGKDLVKAKLTTEDGLQTYGWNPQSKKSIYFNLVLSDDWLLPERLPMYLDKNATKHGEIESNVTIAVGTPIQPYQATNKKYVDNADKNLRLKLSNLEQALNGYVLDTTKEAYADLDSAVLKNSVAVGDNVYPIADKTRALVTRIEGKTTKMVQVLDKSTYYNTETKSGITATNNGDGSWTINGTATANDYINFSSPLSLNDGHKVLLTGNKTASGFTLGLLNQRISDTGNGDIGIIKAGFMKTWGISWKSGAVINNVTITPQLFDLTAMGREDITTVEQFKAEFPDLYPYENGNIYPAKISGVKFTGKNLFNPSTPKYSGESEFDLDGNNITIKQSRTTRYISANFELPNAKFLIGKKISISAKVKTSDNNQGAIRVLWMRNGVAVDTSRTDIISNYATGKTEKNLSASGIVKAPSDDALKLCLLLYSNTEGNLSETKTYTATYSNIQVEISDAPTAYEPYTEPVSVTLPETYDLHGIGDYKDYLEITKNEGNELYTLKKVQVIDKHIFDGTENWSSYGSSDFTNLAYGTASLGSKFINWQSRASLMNLLNRISITKDDEGYAHGDTSADLYIRLPNIATAADMKAHVLSMYEAGTPYIFYGAIATPVETVIATNLTYEQVTAIRHNGGLIEVEGNTNKAYARPTVTNTIVYRLTASAIVDGTSIVKDTDGKIQLNQEYIDYLDIPLYQPPAISVFTMLDAAGAALSTSNELGTTLSAASFNHQETNIKNIQGDNVE